MLIKTARGKEGPSAVPLPSYYVEGKRQFIDKLTKAGIEPQKSIDWLAAHGGTCCHDV